MLATGANAQLVLKEIRTSNMIVTILMNVGKHWGFEKVFATILLEASLAPSVLVKQFMMLKQCSVSQHQREISS